MTIEKYVDIALENDHRFSDKVILNIILLQWLLLSTVGGFIFSNYLFGFVSGAFLSILGAIAYKYLRGTSTLRVLNALPCQTNKSLLHLLKILPD